MTLTVTHTTPADGTFSATGAAAWDANHALTVSGTSGQVQFNSSGDLAGDAGLTFDATNKALTVGGGTVAASFPALSASQTWNNAAVTFTALKLDVTDTASNANSLLMDLRVGGSSKFNVNKTGTATLSGDGVINFNSSVNQFYYSGGFGFKSGGAQIFSITNNQILFGNNDVYLTRKAAANLRFGAADAAAPVAQTLSVQSVVAGTTNTAGANLTITGSQGTGTGAGGSIVFQLAPAGSSGTAQNALVNALELTHAATALSGLANTFALITPLIAVRNYYGAAFILNGSGATNGLKIGPNTSGFLDIETTGLSYYAAAGSVRLSVDAANTLAQRNGVNAQTSRLYATYSTVSDYERGYFTADVNGLTIGTEAAGTGTKRPVRVVGPSLASAEAVSALELSQTWNTTGTPTAFKLDVTNTASNANSLLMDLRFAGASRFSVNRNGTVTASDAFGVGGSVYLNASGLITFGTTPSINLNNALITSRAAANLRFGAADAAAPIAQTLSVQSVVAGPTTNTPGVDFKITGSQGIGSGAGGSIIFQVAPAGTSGNPAQNGLVDALTIGSDKSATFTAKVVTGSGNGNGLYLGSVSFVQLFASSNSTLGLVMGAGTFNFSREQTVNGALCLDKAFQQSSGGSYQWGSTTTANSTPDLFLYRDAANTLAQRNGVNAQTFRLYGTYSTSSDYERIGISWSSTIGYIKPENAGTGSPRLLVVSTGTAVVSTLPAAATAGAGARAFVTDATMTMTLGVGTVVAGGGANSVPVYSDASNWLIG